MTAPGAGRDPRLSVAIIAHNEEERLPACLESLRELAGEIVVVDTLSTDRTGAIAAAAGARVERRALDGFGATKQFAVDCTSGPWVLSIDADERVSATLAQEIRRVIAAPDAAAGYELRRRTVFLGRRMRHSGLNHDWVLRLYRRDAGRFTNAVVHERIEVRGPVERLPGWLEHETTRTLAEYVAKLERYAALGRDGLAARGERYHWWDALRLPINWLLYVVVRLGILDGVPGLIWAAGSAYHSWRKRDLLRERPAAGPAAPR
jgi:glycosyltransferase involved in cell wall biosynthesis